MTEPQHDTRDDDPHAECRAEIERLKGGRRFPLQTDRDKPNQRTSVPWRIGQLAWDQYSAKHRGQSCERIAERGGFGNGEMDTFLPGWRGMADAEDSSLGRAEKAERERDEARKEQDDETDLRSDATERAEKAKWERDEARALLAGIEWGNRTRYGKRCLFCDGPKSPNTEQQEPVGHRDGCRWVKAIDAKSTGSTGGQCG